MKKNLLQKWYVHQQLELTHIIRIMKLSVFFIFVFLFQLQAGNVKSQEVRVTLSKSSLTFGELMREIETQTNYLFMYRDAEIDLSQKIEVKNTSATVKEILTTALRNKKLTYKFSNNYISLYVDKEKAPETMVTQQERKIKIKGVVIDQVGEPIIGANISLKGQPGTGDITDIEGNFTLEVPEKAVLVISYIGYLTQEIPVNGKASFNIQMKEDTKTLDEVVVVGYGSQKKQTVTASASTLKVSSLKNVPTANLASSLGGRVSGVLIQQTGGEAGYDDPTIIIRGSSSPTSSSPLIVVDGIIGRSMSQLDPSEIESMTVLKDASAVAPYGARGANGVILITTKRGKSGKAQVDYNFKIGFGTPTRMPEIASSYDHARFMNDAWRNKEMDLGEDPGMYGIYTEEELQKFRDGSDPYGYPNTDWNKEVLLPRAWQQMHSLTASGGSDKVKYFAGFGYVKQDALYGDTRTNKSTSGFNRYNARVNIDANIVDKYLNLSADMAYRQEDRNSIAGSTSDVFNNMHRNPQTDPGRFPDGNLGKVSLGVNPIGLATEGGWVKDRKSVLNTRFMLDFNVPGLEGLNLKGIFSYDKIFNSIKRWTTPVDFYVWNKITGEYDGHSPNREGAELKQTYSTSQAMTFEFQAAYNKTIAQDHQLGALFVFSRSEGADENFWASRTKYRIYSIQQLFAGPDKDKDNSGSASETGKVGSVFRLTYNYKEKYMLEANGRLDGSEKFPKSKRYGFFPSVSAAWRISAEPFMEPFSGVLSNLKLRTSWGRAGTDNIGQFQYMSAYGTGGDAVFGGQNPEIAPGYTETRFPNPNITWETSEMFNIGIDASFFNGKLNLEADWFYKKTNDILRERTDMPAILGYKLPAANVGKVDNRGIDLNITHRTHLRNFNYSIAGNLTWARNKVIDLLEPAGEKNNPRQRSTGHSMSQYFGYEALGLFQSDEEANNWAQPQFGKAKAGDIKYKDQNGDGIIDAEDEIAIGRSNYPELVYGLNLNAEWKGFDITFFFQGAALADFYYNGYLAFPYIEGRGGALLEHHIGNTWTPENPKAEFPRLYYGGNANNQLFSSFWMRNGSYLRLKNVEIGYDFKKLLLSKVSEIQGLRLYFSGSNLLTWSQIKYFDPELRSTDGSAYPQMKTFVFGANITF